MKERLVVFATDLEGDSASALAVASRLALEHAATLLILHVVPLRTSSGEGMLHEVVELNRDHVRDKLRSVLPPDPSVPYSHRLEVGDPESRIIDIVQDEKTDLLVLRQRARPWWRRGLSRSLSERLVLRAPCPVVVCRDDAAFATAAAAPSPSSVVPNHPLQVLDLLTGLLRPRVEALVTLMDHQRDAVARVAQGVGVRHCVQAILNKSGVLSDRRLRRQLALELSEHQRAMGAVGVSLIAAGDSLVCTGVDAQDEAARAAFTHKVLVDGSAVSLPLEADDSLLGGLVMLVGARVNTTDQDDAMLVFVLDARKHFLRILAQPGPAPSVETYAFDRDGLMLSNSRFPQDLRRLGLLPPEPGAQAPRRLRVCEPVSGATTVAGLKPPGSSALTLMAREATEGRDGSDVRGYSDYRGIKVVGVWRWIPRYEFGVAAEMDRPALWQERAGS